MNGGGLKEKYNKPVLASHSPLSLSPSPPLCFIPHRVSSGGEHSDYDHGHDHGHDHYDDDEGGDYHHGQSAATYRCAAPPFPKKKKNMFFGFLPKKNPFQLCAAGDDKSPLSPHSIHSLPPHSSLLLRTSLLHSDDYDGGHSHEHGEGCSHGHDEH
jgi:hypothetical protein